LIDEIVVVASLENSKWITKLPGGANEYDVGEHMLRFFLIID
jgi:hypothetical protein